MTPASQFEGTIWSSLIVTLGAATYFFSRVFGAWADGAQLGVAEMARLGLAMVVIIVAIEIAFNVAITVWCRSEPQTDERDALIAAKSARNGYYILVSVIVILIGHAGLASLLGYMDALRLDLPMAIALAIFALVVAEIAHYASRLWYYRRGV